MRESIGSVSIFAIVITFIMLITAYLAISVNYAKAFRIKNHIINMIEEYHGEVNNAEFKDKVALYLTSQGYTANKKCPSSSVLTDNNLDTVGVNWNGPIVDDGFAPGNGNSFYCIYELEMDGNRGIDDIDDKRYYYKVITFFKFDIPVIGNLAIFNVSGDTKLVYKDNK